MNNSKTLMLALILGIAIGLLIPELLDYSNTHENDQKPEWVSQVSNKTPQNATFAGGCFWCIEEVFQGEKGVESAISGFTDGNKSTASYTQVASGDTNHREAVRVKFYPSITSYEELLEMYWKSIDPTDPNGQFSDRGFQYTTAIYTHNEKQYKLAKESKENISMSGRFEEPIVTKIKNVTEFYRAADKHQNYSRRNTLQYKAYKRASGRSGFIDKIWN